MAHTAKKQALYALVDALPDGEIEAAERYLTFLADYADRDAPMSDDQRAELRATLSRGVASSKSGDTRPVDEFLADFNEP